MSQIEYVNGSLFDAPKESLLIHACNAQGVWGSGIAKEFKERYPDAFKKYLKDCLASEGDCVGEFGSNINKGWQKLHYVGWLITSENYGDKKDSLEQILINTTLAVKDFCEQFEEGTVYSNKFNSGLFEVPWSSTELVLKTVLKDYPDIKWVVCVNE